MTERLVIRIKLPRDAQPAVPVRQRPSRRTVSMIAGGVVVVLALLGISIGMFKPEPSPAPAVVERRKPASETPQPVEAKIAEPKPVEPDVRQPPPAPPSAVNQVIPNASRNALATIRGTIKVSIRVVVGKDGTVLDAITEIPGPSRYFERVSREAARKWTFGPASSPDERLMLLKFSFSRGGVTARADPLQQEQ